METLLDPLLRVLEPRPVLVDVGASAHSPRVWGPLARHGVYVGFDPDLREMHDSAGGQFHRALLLNEAVSAGPPGEPVTVYFTRAPQCSSTLRPNAEVLANYLFSDRFVVEREESVRATTLDAALSRLDLDRIDWLKLDTQGIDLRLFNSLPDPMRRHVLAVDAEPGLRGAYREEDLFGDLDRELRRQGFWLAGATIKGMPRVRPRTIDELWREHLARPAGRSRPRGENAIQEVAGCLPTCPGWVECRYFRTIESLDQEGLGRREYVLLWAFALAAGQVGFAADVALEHRRRFPAEPDAGAMIAVVATRLRTLWAQHSSRVSRQRGLQGALRRKVRRLIALMGGAREPG